MISKNNNKIDLKINQKFFLESPDMCGIFNGFSFVLESD